jgi:hypothetical protein
MKNEKYEMENLPLWSDPKRKRGIGMDLFPFELS